MSLVADLRMLARGLMGHTPPPLVARRARPGDAARAGSDRPGGAERGPVAAERAGLASVPRAGQARPVVVTAVKRETADAVSLTFRDPTGAPLAFTPGQFFTVEVAIGGERLRRAYSASSDSRTTDTATITVKRVAGGRVSGFLVDQAAPGLSLAVLGPSGEFGLDGAPAHVVAIAGGSGITPIMAIARTRTAPLDLIYGNRDRAAIIFADELAGLAHVRVRHVLGAEGLHAAALAAELAALAPPAGTRYLLCGPAPMMQAAREVLAARGVAPEDVREERFFAPARPAAPLAAQPVTIRRGARAHQVTVPAGATILEAGLAAGVPMELSCAMGGCGACAVTLVDGDVLLDEPSCLTAAERARGVILACVARPTSPCTVEAKP